MGIGSSLFLIAVGAILAFAVNADVSGIEISTVGIILMIVGVIGLLISLFFLGERRADRAVVVERPVVRDREYYYATEPPGGGRCSRPPGASWSHHFGPLTTSRCSRCRIAGRRPRGRSARCSRSW